MAISDGLQAYLGDVMCGFSAKDGGISDDQWSEMRDWLDDIQSEAWNVLMDTEDITNPKERLQWVKDNGLIEEVE